MAKIIFIVCLFLSFTFAVEKEPYEMEIGFDEKLSTDRLILFIKSNIDNLEVRKIVAYTPEKESVAGWVNEINKKTKYTIMHFSDKDTEIVVTFNNYMNEKYEQDDFIKNTEKIK